jgi:hypothetical protein
MVFFLELLAPFALGGHNSLICNPFLMILGVLDVLKGFKFCLDTRSNKALPELVYSNIVIASNVQLNWLMKFKMEIFIPYPLDFNSIWHNIQLGAILMY